MVIFVALVCLLAHHALAITELTDANFYDYAKEKDVLLVNFYAPWCGDCKNLAPDLETAASTLGTRGLDLAKVDCFGAGKGLCDTYGIKRWPTLKNFNRGSYTGDYNGGLTSNEIAGYIATVENSIAPANPYAMAIPPPVTQACMAKCHIAKITNKQPCYSKCKTKNFATHNGVRKLAPVKFSPPKPIINEHSCAKCRIPQPPGKLRKCSRDVMIRCMDFELQRENSEPTSMEINSFYPATDSKRIDVMDKWNQQQPAAYTQTDPLFSPMPGSQYTQQQANPMVDPTGIKSSNVMDVSAANGDKPATQVVSTRASKPSNIIGPMPEDTGKSKLPTTQGNVPLPTNQLKPTNIMENDVKPTSQVHKNIGSGQKHMTKGHRNGVKSKAKVKTHKKLASVQKKTKTLQFMSPDEAMKVPYEKDDRK